MNDLGCDIYLDVKLLSFNRLDIMQKSSIVLERERELPIQIESFFIEEEKVPYGGFVELSLRTVRSATSARSILREIRRVPEKKWYSYIGKIYNDGQKILRRIPKIGPLLEETVPDACQKVKLHYHISITKEKQMSYWIHLNRLDNTTLRVFQGKVLLK